jgi:hypothetical protein
MIKTLMPLTLLVRRRLREVMEPAAISCVVWVNLLSTLVGDFPNPLNVAPCWSQQSVWCP